MRHKFFGTTLCASVSSARAGRPIPNYAIMVFHAWIVALWHATANQYLRRLSANQLATAAHRGKNQRLPKALRLLIYADATSRTCAGLYLPPNTWRNMRSVSLRRGSSVMYWRAFGSRDLLFFTPCMMDLAGMVKAFIVTVQ